MWSFSQASTDIIFLEESPFKPEKKHWKLFNLILLLLAFGLRMSSKVHSTKSLFKSNVSNKNDLVIVSIWFTNVIKSTKYQITVKKQRK